ncbi:MAG: hypothetical protein KKD44_16785 [Proteobacteria bacterium]|nr:hypothetical protein [Pseudomonadota bacterium]
MQDIKNNEWIMNEYKLLSEHYFHEDNFYLKTNSIFMTLNAVMVGFLGRKPGDTSINFTDDFLIMFSIIGFISVISWGLTLMRTHVYRMKIEERIAEIEHNFCDILKIRTKRSPLPFYAKIPSSIIILILPAVFSFVWLYHLYVAIS